MLRNVIKLITFLAAFLISGCSSSYRENDLKRNQDIVALSRKIVGDQEYKKIHKQIRDTLQMWELAKLPGFEWGWAFKYQLDSALCFNNERDRMVTAVLAQCDKFECSQDDIHYLYGAKIKDRWYFFQGGGTMVIIRKYHQKDIHTPLSFVKLHELAMNNMLRGYIKKNKEGEWEVNDAFFTHHFENSGWGNFDRQLPKDTLSNGQHFTDKRAYFENIYLRVARNIWPPKKEK